MSDALSFAALNRLDAELLPARTVLSMFAAADQGSGPVGGGNLVLDLAKMAGIPGPSNGPAGSSSDGATGA